MRALGLSALALAAVTGAWAQELTVVRDGSQRR